MLVASRATGPAPNKHSSAPGANDIVPVSGDVRVTMMAAANHSQRRMALLHAEGVCSNQGGKKAARPFDGDSYFSASNGWVIFATGKMRHTQNCPHPPNC